MYQYPNYPNHTYNYEYKTPVLILVFGKDQPFYISRHHDVRALKDDSSADKLVLQKWKANNHVSSYDFKKYPLRVMRSINKSPEEHCVVVFEKSQYYIRDYSLWVGGRVLNLEHKLKSLLMFCDVEPVLVPAFKLVVLAVVNKMVKARSFYDIALPKDPYFDLSNPDLVQPKLASLLTVYATSDEKHLDRFISEFISCTEVQHFAELPLPISIKERAAEKYLRFFKFLYKKKRTQKVVKCLRNFVVLLNGGNAAILLNLFGHVVHKSSDEDFLRMMESIDFSRFEWKGQLFGNIKASLVGMFESLVLGKGKKKVQFSSVRKLVRKVLDNLHEPPLGFADFEFFFLACLNQSVRTDEYDRLARFCFYSYGPEQADLVYSRVFQRDAKRLVTFSLRVIDYFNGRYGHIKKEESAPRAHLKKFRDVVKAQFRKLYGVKRTLSDLTLPEFQKFNAYLGDFLEDELEALDRLKFSDSSWSANYHITHRLKEVVKNEFLVKQFECELRDDNPQQPRLVPAVRRLLEDKYVLKNLLEAFGSERKIFTKHHNSFVDFFVGALLEQVEVRFGNKKENFGRDIEVREKLLELAKHLPSAGLLEKAKRLVMHEFNATFDFKGKFRFIEVLSKPKERVSHWENGQYRYFEFDYSRLFREVGDQIVIDEDDFDLDNRDFWEKLVAMAEGESGFDQMFRKCLGLLDRAFKYSASRFQAQKGLFRLESGCSWENRFIDVQRDRFSELLETGGLDRESIFDEKHRGVPDLFKLFGVCCNTRQMKNLVMIKKLVKKKKGYWARGKDLYPFFKGMQVVRFLVDFFERIDEGRLNYFESSIAEFLSTELNLKDVDASLEAERTGNEKVKKLFKGLRFLENDAFLSRVVDFEGVCFEMAKFDEVVRLLPERKVVVPEALEHIVENQRLIRNSERVENRNGLVYLLGKRDHFACLEHVLEIDQLIELKRILGKLGEGEEEKLRKTEFEQESAGELLDLEEDRERQQEEQRQNEEEEEEENDQEEEEDIEDIEEEQPNQEQLNPPVQEQNPGTTPNPEPQVSPQNPDEATHQEKEPEPVHYDEYKRVPLDEVIECLTLNETFSENLSKLQSNFSSGLIGLFYKNDVQISYRRVSFMMRGALADKMETPVMKNVQRHVLFLRNSSDFAEFAQTVSDFLGFSDRARLDFYYQDFFHILKQKHNDDLVSVLNSIKDVPKIFFDVSSKSNPILKLFRVMHSGKESKSHFFIPSSRIFCKVQRTLTPSSAQADQGPVLDNEEGGLRKRDGNADRPPGARGNRPRRQALQLQKTGLVFH